MIEVLTPERTQALTSLARVKSDLGLTDSEPTRDAWLEDLIEEASHEIAEAIDFVLGRRRVRERLPGTDRSLLVLTERPVVSIEEVEHDTLGVLDVSEYRLHRGGAGQVYRNDGWPADPFRRDPITLDPSSELGAQPWRITYRCGWLLPGDNIAASGFTIASGTNTIARGSGRMPLLASGDIAELRNFGQAANTGRFIVQAAGDLFVTLDGPLSAETAPGGAEIRVRDLPRELERLTMQTVKAWYLSGTRDPSVTSERLGDWAATYGGATTGNARALPAAVADALERWARAA